MVASGSRMRPKGKALMDQLGFIGLILALERSFRILEVRWPRWVQALPGYTVGSLGAFWTVQRVALLFGGAR